MPYSVSMPRTLRIATPRRYRPDTRSGTRPGHHGLHHRCGTTLVETKDVDGAGELLHAPFHLRRRRDRPRRLDDQHGTADVPTQLGGELLHPHVRVADE